MAVDIGLSLLPFYKITSTMHTGFKIPVIRLTGSMVVTYDQKYDYPSRSEAQIENEKNLRDITYNGYMSPKTKSKVRKYLTTWVNSINSLKGLPVNPGLKKVPYLTFVTLTLPSKQNHSDNEMKREALMPFIETLKRKHDVWNYFWRAEAQENGNIHFHLIVDSYIRWESIRFEWNSIMEKLGYIEPFFLKYNHRNPNSTDIHRLGGVGNSAEYLLKYVSKSDGYRKIEGRIHGCSDRVRVLNPYECELDNTAYEAIIELKKSKEVRKIEEELYSVFMIDQDIWFGPNWEKLKERETKYLREVAIDLYTNKAATPIESAMATALEYYEQNTDNYVQLTIGYESEPGYNYYLLHT